MESLDCNLIVVYAFPLFHFLFLLVLLSSMGPPNKELALKVFLEQISVELNLTERGSY